MIDPSVVLGFLVLVCSSEFFGKAPTGVIGRLRTVSKPSYFWLGARLRIRPLVEVGVIIQLVRGGGSARGGGGGSRAVAAVRVAS